MNRNDGKYGMKVEDMPEGFAQTERLFGQKSHFCHSSVALELLQHFQVFSALSWTGLAHFWSNHWKFSALLLEFPIHLGLPATFPQGWRHKSMFFVEVLQISGCLFCHFVWLCLTYNILTTTYGSLGSTPVLDFPCSLFHEPYFFINISSLYKSLYLRTETIYKKFVMFGSILPCRFCCYRSEVQKRCSGNKTKRNNDRKKTPCTSSRWCALGRLAVAAVTTSPSAPSLFPTRPSTSWSEISQFEHKSIATYRLQPPFNPVFSKSFNIAGIASSCANAACRRSRLTTRSTSVWSSEKKNIKKNNTTPVAILWPEWSRKVTPRRSWLFCFLFSLKRSM